ncbi:hypothetical protein KQX54_019682 [Cotesia glomerata]|uniref:Uncharacterized protein n=1 Tax=Cotesia glomerata TaxID=32391 RepID=A0AAV7I1N0_COTGL|nr:hypothetical protein KQX54_019682 [Cotesia glomerata]
MVLILIKEKVLGCTQEQANFAPEMNGVSLESGSGFHFNTGSNTTTAIFVFGSQAKPDCCWEFLLLDSSEGEMEARYFCHARGVEYSQTLVESDEEVIVQRFGAWLSMNSYALMANAPS